MATVTSLTATRIQELLAGWESVGLSQDEINALVIQLKTSVTQSGAIVENFTEQKLPQFESDLAESVLKISELSDVDLPTMEEKLDQADLDLQNLLLVQIPAMRTEMEETILSVQERPNVYFTDEAPTDPDIDGRFLVVGDTWFDTDDNNKQRMWNGVEWGDYGVDVADFSLTAKKFKTSTHMLY